MGGWETNLKEDWLWKCDDIRKVFAGDRDKLFFERDPLDLLDSMFLHLTRFNFLNFKFQFQFLSISIATDHLSIGGSFKISCSKSGCSLHCLLPD